MASVLSSAPLRLNIALLALFVFASLAAAFAPSSGSFLRVRRAVSSGRCAVKIGLKASAEAAGGERREKGDLFDSKGNAKASDKAIDRFNSKQFTSETAVVTSKFVGDQQFQDNFVSELDYWTKFRQQTMDEFKQYKSSQEELLKSATQKLEDAQGKQESLGFIPFVDFEKPVKEAQAEVFADSPCFRIAIE